MVRKIEIAWADLPINATGVYQVMGKTLLLILRPGSDPAAALDRTMSILADAAIKVHHNPAISAVPAPIIRRLVP